MFIDILVLVAIISAVWKGYQKGLLMALFNTLSLIVGLAAAVKLSSVVGPWLASSFQVESKYLPFISFALVLLVVIIVIRFLANMIQRQITLFAPCRPNLFGWPQDKHQLLPCVVWPFFAALQKRHRQQQPFHHHQEHCL